MLDRLAQRLAHLRLGEVAATAQRSAYPTSRPTADATRNRLCVVTVEPGHALQQQVAQATRKLAALVARSREELFGEEGVAFRAGDDGVGQRRR